MQKLSNPNNFVFNFTFHETIYLYLTWETSKILEKKSQIPITRLIPSGGEIIFYNTI